jgi:hypothetical protein
LFTHSQALALLANLLMRDYVKWRGSLFHRFCLALVDPAPVVKALAEHLLGDTLAAKVRVCRERPEADDRGEDWVVPCENCSMPAHCIGSEEHSSLP